MTENQHYPLNEGLETFYHSEKRHLREKVAIFHALEKKFGVGVRELVKEERAKSIRSQWSEIAKQTSGISIKDLIETLWDPLQQKGIVHYEVIETKETKTRLKVTSCLFARLVKELNIPRDWGYDLYCSDDEHMVRGFNQRMKFIRSKTLMEGHDCCDHCYQMTKVPIQN